MAAVPIPYVGGLYLTLLGSVGVSMNLAKLKFGGMRVVSGIRLSLLTSRFPFLHILRGGITIENAYNYINFEKSTYAGFLVSVALILIKICWFSHKPSSTIFALPSCQSILVRDPSLL